MDDHR